MMLANLLRRSPKEGEEKVEFFYKNSSFRVEIKMSKNRKITYKTAYEQYFSSICKQVGNYLFKFITENPNLNFQTSAVSFHHKKSY